MGGKKKTADTYKAQGNLAFQRQEYERAVKLYTQGLALNPSHTVLLTNRAAAYILLHQYTDAVADAQRALDIDPTWQKGYFRLATALRELGQKEAALEVARRGSEELTSLVQSIEEELAAEQYPEPLQYLVDWLSAAGAECPKLHVKETETGWRGVFAKAFIAVLVTQANERILYVPASHIITLELAKSSELGVQLQASQVELFSPKHSFFALFLLTEQRNLNSFWKPYLRTLPSDFSSFPVFYSEETLTWLQGSPFLVTILQRQQDIAHDYRTICNSVPALKEFSQEAFTQARMIASSRNFCINKDGSVTDVLVPLADMLNHQRPQQTAWAYAQDLGGFSIVASAGIVRGAEVFDSYGSKCNSRYLLNYGFTVTSNDLNGFQFKLDLFEEDPLHSVKSQLFEGPCRVLHVVPHMQHTSFHELLGMLRVLVLRSTQTLERLLETCVVNREFEFERVYPLSLANEREVLNTLLNLTQHALAMYPTSAEDDQAMLDSAPLTPSQRDCVTLRLGEKQVLRWFEALANTSLALLGRPEKELRRCATKSVYEPYITHCLIPLNHSSEGFP